MKNSPWAKLIRRTTPNMRARPAATMAYIEPSVSPWISCSSRSSMPPHPHALSPYPLPLRGRGMRDDSLSRSRERVGVRVGPLLTPRLLEDGGAGRDPFQNSELYAIHLEDEHVYTCLMVIVALHQ